MTFWIIICVLGLAIAALLILAMFRPPTPSEDLIEYDLRIYRDQLKEVDRDLARKALTQDEAERSRVEISRRILEADKARTAETQRGTTDHATARIAGLTLALVTIAGAGWLYWTLGAPGYGDFSLKDRIAITEENRLNRPSQAQVEASFPPWTPINVDPGYLDLIGQLRAAVADRPNDLQGHIFLARNEANIGNLTASYAALAQIIDIKGDAATADDYTAYARMLVLAAGDYVSPTALEAVQNALRLDPTNDGARYYIGLSEAQIGRPDRAFSVWRAVLEGSATDTPWTAFIRTQIEDAALRAGIEYTLPAQSAPVQAPGPTAEDLAAAEHMTPAERMEMIEGMVAGLSDRLANEGGTASDWARLIAAYGVLGRAEDARAIWTEAQTVFAGRDQDLGLLTSAATRAGLIE